MATSSLHALSNSIAMTRNDKPSPHSSPRLSRRSGNVGQGNEIYASQMQQQPLQQQQQQQQAQQQPQTNLTSTHSLHSINGNQQSQQQQCISNNNHNHAAVKATPLVPKLPPNIVLPAPSQTVLNRMSAPQMSTTSSSVALAAATAPTMVPSSSSAAVAIGATASQQFLMNKVLNKAQSADINDILNAGQDPAAPPLPPRKSSPSVIDSSVNRLLKPHTNSSVTAASSLVNLSTNTNMSASMSRSSENITSCDFNVPRDMAPPIPKHAIVPTAPTRTSPPPLPPSQSNGKHPIDVIDNDLRHVSFAAFVDDDCDKVIVGPAETISGIIDTRPLEARKPIEFINAVDKDSATITASNGTNNLYHLKTTTAASHPSSHQTHTSQMRHQSFPGTNPSSANGGSSGSNSSGLISAPPKSMTTPHFGHETASTKSNFASSSAAGSSKVNLASGNSRQNGGGPLLYENVAIHTNDCNVPYENINLEYIARLMDEGYSKENVITALGISRNNIEMACDILHEFVSKSSA